MTPSPSMRLLLVAVLLLFLSTSLAFNLTSQYLRSTTIELGGAYDEEDEGMEDAKIDSAIEYAISLGSNTVIATGFYDTSGDTAISKVLFENTILENELQPYHRVLPKFVTKAKTAGLRVGIVMPLFIYHPYDEDYVLIQKSDTTLVDYSNCSSDGMLTCRMSPFAPSTGVFLTELFTQLLNAVPAIDMIVISDDGTMNELEDCSVPALNYYESNVSAELATCAEVHALSGEAAIDFAEMKAAMISKMLASVVNAARSETRSDHVLIARQVYITPFLLDGGDIPSSVYTAQSCKSMFDSVDIVFPFAFPYFEKIPPNTRVGDKNDQYRFWFKAVYDALQRCDPTLFRVVPSLQIYNWDTTAPVDQNEVETWLAYLINELGFPHVHLSDTDFWHQYQSVGNIHNLMQTGNNNCYHPVTPLACSPNTCVTEVLSPTHALDCHSATLTDCFSTPSSCPLAVDRCAVFSKAPGCPNDPCTLDPTLPKCSNLYITKINTTPVDTTTWQSTNMAVNSADMNTLQGQPAQTGRLFPNDVITLGFNAQQLIGATPQYITSNIANQVSVYMRYTNFDGTSMITAFVAQRTKFDLAAEEIQVTLPSDLKPGYHISFRMKYIIGTQSGTITTDSTLMSGTFVGPTCVDTSVVPTLDNAGKLIFDTGDLCQNGTKCNSATNRCTCTDLWPTYIPATSTDFCTNTSSQYITCANGGTVSRGTSGTGHWQCDCPTGFSGVTCEIVESCVGTLTCSNNGFVARDATSSTQCANRCTCVDSWTSTYCNRCGRVCVNGGRQTKNCQSCTCPVNYSGDYCQCRYISFSLTLSTVPQTVLDTFDQFGTDQDGANTFLINWFGTQLVSNIGALSSSLNAINQSNLNVQSITIKTDATPNRLSIAGYIVDNCKDTVDTNNYSSLQQSWNSFTEHLKSGTIQLDGEDVPAEVESTQANDPCDSLYPGQDQDPDACAQDEDDDNASSTFTSSLLLLIVLSFTFWLY